jgi:hypothetical protein
MDKRGRAQRKAGLVMKRYIHQELLGNWYIVDTQDAFMVIAVCSKQDKAAMICEAMNGGVI